MGGRWVALTNARHRPCGRPSRRAIICRRGGNNRRQCRGNGRARATLTLSSARAREQDGQRRGHVLGRTHSACGCGSGCSLQPRRRCIAHVPGGRRWTLGDASTRRRMRHRSHRAARRSDVGRGGRDESNLSLRRMPCGCALEGCDQRITVGGRCRPPSPPGAAGWGPPVYWRHVRAGKYLAWRATVF